MGDFGKAMGISAGETAINAVGNLGATAINQLFYRKNARFQAELAEQAAQRDYARQVEFWNMQNKYNDPKAQASRMRAAGLNPVGVADSGNSSNLSNTPTSNGGVGAQTNVQSPEFDMMRTLDIMSQIDKRGKEGNVLTQQLALGMQDILLKQTENHLKRLGLTELAERIEEQRQLNKMHRLNYRKALGLLPLELMSAGLDVDSKVLNNRYSFLRNYYQEKYNKHQDEIYKYFKEHRYLPGTRTQPSTIEAIFAKYLDQLLDNLINPKPGNKSLGLDISESGSAGPKNPNSLWDRWSANFYNGYNMDVSPQQRALYNMW